MAKLYNTKTKEILWSDTDIFCDIEDAYCELQVFLADKRLNGHDRYDQWYMAMYNKLDELIELMGKCPIDETDPNIQELF